MMTVPYSMRQQGYMQVDNGAPCLTEDQARAMGLPREFARKSVVEMDMMHCRCCGISIIKNPDRTRPRGHCSKCNWFACDSCSFEASLPGYVHESFLEKVEKAKTAAANLSCI